MSLTFAAPDGIRVHLKSPSGDLIAILSDNDESGEILQAETIELNIGGLDSFTFNIPKRNNLTLSKGTECWFYVSNNLFAVGEISDTPEQDQSDPVLNIMGDGFWKRLLKTTVNESYTAQTLAFIIDDLASTYLSSVGLVYDVLKITAPVISNITIEFDDKTLEEAFLSCLQIANFDYTNERYRYFIDVDKKFNFELIDNSPVRQLFEGFQYQAPEVIKDFSKIINSILTYRTTQADRREVEFVATYEDLTSQGQYGLEQKKITFPDFADTPTIERLAESIIQKNKDPQKTVNIEDMEVSAPLVFGSYLISNRRELYWFLLSSCDTLEGWDLTNAPNTTITASDERILTGNRSLKFVTQAGSINEYIEFTLDEAIPLPQMVRAFMYFASTPNIIELSFFDKENNSISINFGTATDIIEGDLDLSTEDVIEGNLSPGDSDELEADIFTDTVVDQWMLLTTNIGLNTEVVEICGYDGLTILDNILVDIDEFTEGNLEGRQIVEPGLLNVKKVRLTILDDTATTFYLDHIDVFANAYSTSKLVLEEVKHNLSSVGLLAAASFGQKPENLIDEINKKVKEGDIALSIFSKQ